MHSDKKNNTALTKVRFDQLELLRWSTECVTKITPVQNVFSP